MIYNHRSDKEIHCTIHEDDIPDLKQALGKASICGEYLCGSSIIHPYQRQIELKSIPVLIPYDNPLKHEIYYGESNEAWVAYQIAEAKFSQNYKKVLKIMLATPTALSHLLPRSLAVGQAASPI